MTYPLQTSNACGKNFIQLSGEDATFLSFLISGGVGCISVSANIIPRLHSEMYNLWNVGEFKKAMKINHNIYELNSALFLETSPAPVKYALSVMGKCNSKLRLPLVDVNKSTKEKIKRVLSSLNII